MRTFTVRSIDNGKRLDRFLFSVLPDVSTGIIRKAFKDRDVKVNGIREKDTYVVHEKDLVELFVSEDRLQVPSQKPVEQKDIHFLYEDNDIFIVVKPQGIIIQSDPTHKGYTESFEKQVQKCYFAQHPSSLPGFPALCHRLDRNTGGLVIFAKHIEALEQMKQLFSSHRVRKFYLCIVVGVPQKPKAQLDAYLEKVTGESRVYIHDLPKSNAKPIITRYEVIASHQNLSLLKVEIVTGRTHQIRAQLAWIGHPVVGDSKYGSNAINRKYRLKQQALWSYQLLFGKSSSSQSLSKLDGLQVTIDSVPWEPPLHDLFNDDTIRIINECI